MKHKNLLFLSGLIIILTVCLSLWSNAFDCGDVNIDGNINVFDITYTISYLYLGGPPPPEPRLADINNSGEINIFDVTDLISFLYLGGAEPNCPPPMGPPYGNLVNIIDCHERGYIKVSIEEDCIEYTYDGASTLLIKHINAGFNCCPLQLYSNISIAGNQITIYEYETFDTAGPCPCMCLYELNYEINNLPPGEYTIEIQGQCVYPDDDYLEYTADLVSSPVGEYCLYRGYYPWEDWGAKPGN